MTENATSETPLVLRDEQEYELEGPRGDTSVCIQVETLSVYLKKGDDGVSITVYPRNPADPRDANESIVETWAMFSEGE